MLFCKAIETFFLLGPKGRKFCDGDVLSVLSFLFTTFKRKVDNFIQILNEIIMLQFRIQSTEIIGRYILNIFSLIDLPKLMLFY